MKNDARLLRQIEATSENFPISSVVTLDTGLLRTIYVTPDRGTNQSRYETRCAGKERFLRVEEFERKLGILYMYCTFRSRYISPPGKYGRN